MLPSESVVLTIVDRMLRALFAIIGYKPSTSLADATMTQEGQLVLNLEPIITGTYGGTEWQVNVEIGAISFEETEFMRTVHSEPSPLHGETNLDNSIITTVAAKPVRIRGAIAITMDATTHREALSRMELIAMAMVVFKAEIMRAARLETLGFATSGLNAFDKTDSARSTTRIDIGFSAVYIPKFYVDYRETGIIGRFYNVWDTEDEISQSSQE